MLTKAKNKYNTDMNNSWMIGDKEDDVKTANAAGINKTILVKSGHSIDEFNSDAMFILDTIQQTKNVITI